MDDNQEEEELRRDHAYLPYMGGRGTGVGVDGETHMGSGCEHTGERMAAAGVAV